MCKITHSCPKSRNKLAEANKAKLYQEIEVSDALDFHLPLSNPHFEIFALIKYQPFVFVHAEARITLESLRK